MKKRIFSLFLVLCMMFTAVPLMGVSVFAEGEHTHQWNYVADGATLYAYCTQACTYAENDFSVTLVFDSFTQKVVLNAQTLVGEALPAVLYEGTGETVYEKCATPPVHNGTYLATLTVGEATAELAFTKTNEYLSAGEGSEFIKNGFTFVNGINKDAGDAIFSDGTKLSEARDSHHLATGESQIVILPNGFVYADGTVYDVYFEITNLYEYELSQTWYWSCDLTVETGDNIYLTVEPLCHSKSKCQPTHSINFEMKVWLQKGNKTADFSYSAGACYVNHGTKANDPEYIGLYTTDGKLYSNYEYGATLKDNKRWNPDNKDDNKSDRYLFGKGADDDNKVSLSYNTDNGNAEWVIGYFTNDVTFVAGDEKVSFASNSKTYAEHTEMGTVDVTCSDGYMVKYWTLNKDVVLANGKQKAAGDKLTVKEFAMVYVTEPLTATAYSCLIHEHDWKYSATGNVITAECKGENKCSYVGDDYQLTLTAEDATYDGKPHGAKITEEALAGQDALPGIVYKGVSGTTYNSSIPPVNAGSYEASVTVGAATAVKAFTIAKANRTVDAPVLVSASCTGVQVQAVSGIQFAIATSNTAPTAGFAAQTTFTNVQTGTDYYIFAKYPADNNYNEAVSTGTKVTPNHDWNDATYAWSNNNTVCTATRTCKNDALHIETETGTVASTASTPATCTTKGKTTYTATFTKAWTAKQEKTVEDINALDHDWNTVTYEWNTDNTQCTAKRICKRDASHVEAETVNVTNKITTPATCTAKGKTTYTAAFTKAWAVKQEKTVENIPELNHTWNDATYEWSNNNTVCTAKRICKNDKTHVETAVATVTSQETVKATCKTEGETTYNAEFEKAWALPQTVTVTVEKLPHKDEDGNNHCDECNALVGEPREVTYVTKQYLGIYILSGAAIKNDEIVALNGTVITEENGRTGNESYTQTVDDEIRFTVTTGDKFTFEEYKVTVNGVRIYPNGDGVYTVSAGVEDINIQVEGTVREVEDGENLSAWEKIYQKFRSIIQYILSWFKWGSHSASDSAVDSAADSADTVRGSVG